MTKIHELGLWDLKRCVILVNMASTLWDWLLHNITGKTGYKDWLLNNITGKTGYKDWLLNNITGKTGYKRLVIK